MKKITWLPLLALVLGSIFAIQSCRKDYDIPPDNSGYDPKLTVTHTIAQVQEFTSGSIINEDIIISGIVNIDDREGNYYKKITIQDETGGIEILLDQNNLYNDYPVGRKVYVKLKGLYKGDNSETPQIGYTPDGTGSLSNIPYTIIDRHIVKANYPNELTPIEVTLAELASPSSAKHLINKLVIIKDAEFAPELIGQTYADPASLRSATNRTLQECGSSTKIVLRTSGYAKFQPEKIPGGRGSIIAIYTRFGSTPQLYIRSTADVNFEEERCDGSSPTGPEMISIAHLKELYSGSSMTLSSYKITGTVISDRANGNINANNLIIQQGDRGIMVRFSSAHTFNLGDSLVVIVTGSKLEEYYNLLQVNNVLNANASKVGTGTILPKMLTISELLANFENHESTLVKVVNASTSESGSFLGNKIITDGSGGSITLYTANDASFASSPLPTSPFNVTAIVGQYRDTKQLQMRNPSDIE